MKTTVKAKGVEVSADGTKITATKGHPVNLWVAVQAAGAEDAKGGMRRVTTRPGQPWEAGTGKQIVAVLPGGFDRQRAEHELLKLGVKAATPKRPRRACDPYWSAYWSAPADVRVDGTKLVNTTPKAELVRFLADGPDGCLAYGACDVGPESAVDLSPRRPVALISRGATMVQVAREMASRGYGYTVPPVARWMPCLDVEGLAWDGCEALNNTTRSELPVTVIAAGVSEREGLVYAAHVLIPPLCVAELDLYEAFRGRELRQYLEPIGAVCQVRPGLQSLPSLRHEMGLSWPEQMWAGDGCKQAISEGWAPPRADRFVMIGRAEDPSRVPWNMPDCDD